MTKSIQQLEKDLADLEKQISEFALTFSQKYQQYLDILSHLARGEIILVSYQICTEIYPQRFLELTTNQRQQLQEQIRNYANSIENRLKNALDFSNNEPSQTIQDREYLANFKKPQELLMWSNNVEHKIHQVFIHYSNLLNQYFMELEIFPETIAPKILENQAESPSLNGYNSLVHLIIASDESLLENKEPKISNIIVVNLKLAQLEFNNPTIEREHRQIRSYYEQLKNIAQIYKKTEQELTVAKSQAAWRALWYDKFNPPVN
ncbi:MAG: hypothetical protein WCO81_02255 [Cyanobacteriota bacterium ELA615]